MNIPHVIASFYDNNGKVSGSPMAMCSRRCFRNRVSRSQSRVPKSVAGKVQNFHVVVNQYSLQKS